MTVTAWTPPASGSTGWNIPLDAKLEEIIAALNSMSSAAVVYSQPSALGTWTISHTFGRLVEVAVYVNGDLVVSDLHCTTDTVTITFASPTAGYAILT